VDARLATLVMVSLLELAAPFGAALKTGIAEILLMVSVTKPLQSANAMTLLLGFPQTEPVDASLEKSFNGTE